MANKSYIYYDLQVLFDNSGMSNEEIAENILCCTPITFSRKMNGLSKFTNRDIALICAAFGIPDEKVYYYFIEPCTMIYKEIRDMVRHDYYPFASENIRC